MMKIMIMLSVFVAVLDLTLAQFNPYGPYGWYDGLDSFGFMNQLPHHPMITAQNPLDYYEFIQAHMPQRGALLPPLTQLPHNDTNSLTAKMSKQNPVLPQMQKTLQNSVLQSSSQNSMLSPQNKMLQPSLMPPQSLPLISKNQLLQALSMPTQSSTLLPPSVSPQSLTLPSMLMQSQISTLPPVQMSTSSKAVIIPEDAELPLMQTSRDSVLPLMLEDTPNVILPQISKQNSVQEDFEEFADSDNLISTDSLNIMNVPDISNQPLLNDDMSNVDLEKTSDLCLSPVT